MATLLGVILLIVAVFRSLRPLLLCVISIGIGALAGTVATLLIFGELHLMTLVMSMSVIGISADYTLYYLTERMVHGNDVSPWQSPAKVRNALLLALLTTVAAYLIMMLAPSRNSPDGDFCRRRVERLLSDRPVLASVAVPWPAGAPGSGDGADAALAGSVAAQ